LNVTGETILLVEDNPLNTKLICAALQHEGYVLLTAADAVEAQALLAGRRPDLILMDLHMPGMNGFDLTRLIKADPATRDVIVVAVTAAAMKGDEERARAAGCDGYLTKPIDVRSFGATVAGFLSRGRGAGRG
jgi:CheY-like chemotaxis protein